MSKQSTSIVGVCVSFFLLGFTQVSIAASTDPTLLDIPPPPSLRGPPAGNQSQENTATYNTGKNSPATVGTNKSSASLNNTLSAEAPQTSSSKKSLFNKANDISATSTQSDNANAVNAATKAAARKAASAVFTPTGVMWGNQIFPAANTMYSTPQRR